MKTINSQIDIFNSLESAERAFQRSTVPCQMLYFKFGRSNTWFVDRSKEAIKDWPQNYTLQKEK